MTKQYPAICSAHPWVMVYHADGIGRHRRFANCDAVFLGIYTKAYKKWKAKQEKEASK